MLHCQLTQIDKCLGTPNEVPSEMVLPDPFMDVFWICLCGKMLGCELGTVVESLFIGSYVYHSDVIAGMQLCY